MIWWSGKMPHDDVSISKEKANSIIDRVLPIFDEYDLTPYEVVVLLVSMGVGIASASEMSQDQIKSLYDIAITTPNVETNKCKR